MGTRLADRLLAGVLINGLEMRQLTNGAQARKFADLMLTGRPRLPRVDQKWREISSEGIHVNLLFGSHWHRDQSKDRALGIRLQGFSHLTISRSVGSGPGPRLAE